jgi:hypothetical protein
MTTLGPPDEGLISNEKISVGIARVQQALGISTIPIGKKNLIMHFLLLLSHTTDSSFTWGSANKKIHLLFSIAKLLTEINIKNN